MYIYTHYHVNFDQIGLITGVALAVILFLGFGVLSSLFTEDSEVLKIARSGTLVSISDSQNFFGVKASLLHGPGWMAKNFIVNK